MGVDMTVPSTISVPLVLRFLEILEHDKLTFSQFLEFRVPQFFKIFIIKSNKHTFLRPIS